METTSRPTPAPGALLLDGHIDVPAERVAAVAAALPEHIRLTREEPGCRYFSVTACPDVAGRLLVSEIFADEAAFEAHQARTATSAWAEVSKDIPRQFDIRTA